MAIAGLFVLALCLASVAAKVEKDVTQLQIGVKLKPKECPRKSHNKDTVKVHYTGMLTDGSVFDSSVTRGDPFQFKLGVGQVIKGWDIGVLGMCIGEKRKLKIPSSMGYGDAGSPPKIPGGATLIFEVELLDVVDDVADSGEGEDLGDDYPQDGEGEGDLGDGEEDYPEDEASGKEEL